MESPAVSYIQTDLITYFLRLGTIGFGGPPALVSAMHRDLVMERRCISEDDYREGLALAQLAIYLGYVYYGMVGATLAGLAFVLPSFIMVLAGVVLFGRTLYF